MIKLQKALHRQNIANFSKGYFNQLFFTLLFLFSVLSVNNFLISGETISLKPPKLLSVSRIWDNAEHNAFTDLIEYQGAFFCSFRESDEHAGGKDGSVRLLRSEDGASWDSVALLNKSGYDLRDPKFSIMPDGRLLLTLGGSLYNKTEYLGSNPFVAFSNNGIDWSDIQNVAMSKEWIWRVTWHQNFGYAVSYRLTDPSNIELPWILTLLQTQDGLNYTPITELDVPSYPSETTLRFQQDGTMVALTRRYGNGWIGTASFPYTTWSWSEIDSRLGGPNFLILPDDQMWAASRLYVLEGEELLTYTALGRMTHSSYTPELILPSGGDTSYPGLVYHKGILYVSYYSSHEGKSSIYLAQVLLPDL